MTYALFNTETNEIVSRGLDADKIDYLLYKKNYIKYEFLKVIENPCDNQFKINTNGSLIFKNEYKPKFLGLNY
jgi:hypothetical protein